MNIFVNILVPILCLIFGYILGSIPTAVWIGKVFFHQDPRDYGSHNMGGTNAGRLWGKKVGLTIIILDMLKTILPVWIAWAILTFAPINNGTPLCASVNNVNNFGINCDYMICYPVYWIVALGSIIGHCFPCFASFKGGKGVSCFMGIVVSTSWVHTIAGIFSYFGVLKLKKYVSLASIVSAIVMPTISWIWAILLATKVVPANMTFFIMNGMTLVPGFVQSAVLTVMAAILIIRHKGNIERLKNGTEKKIKWMK